MSAEHDGWIVVYEDGYVLGDSVGHVRLFSNAGDALMAAAEEALPNGEYMARPAKYDVAARRVVRDAD